jgi:hypothetical protein
MIRLPKKLQVFTNFWPPKLLQTFIAPAYCPRLSPPDYYLFPMFKIKLKFLDVAQIQEVVTDEIKKI